MDALTELITRNDWNLLCWEDRYGRGIWAIVAPHPNHTYKIREITDEEGMLISIMKVLGFLLLMEIM